MKRCGKCQRTLPLDDFWKAARGGQGRQSRCKSCAGAQTREWQRINADRAKVHDRRKTLRGRYGPDAVERYEMLYEMQQGRCAICGKPERLLDGAGRVTRLAVDHCHETGRVRGLLCRSCNGLLGQIGDTAEAIHRFLRYVDQPPGSSLPADLSRPKRWARDWDACRECEKTERHHVGQGYCKNCYARIIYRAKARL